jgi:putative N-acetyltransferase (TIGR04045 family)
MTAMTTLIDPAVHGFRVRLASHPAEFAGAYQLRHQVFCVEQGIFENDLDAIDGVANTIVACAENTEPDIEVVGTVRIHQTEPGHWMGSRLAVVTGWRRRARLGAALIRTAVGTARARGCKQFLAHVQQQNVKMFETLHWQSLESCDVHGRPHSLMQADLLFYPPIWQQTDTVRSAA